METMNEVFNPRYNVPQFSHTERHAAICHHPLSNQYEADTPTNQKSLSYSWLLLRYVYNLTFVKHVQNKALCILAFGVVKWLLSTMFLSLGRGAYTTYIIKGIHVTSYVFCNNGYIVRSSAVTTKVNHQQIFCPTPASARPFSMELLESESKIILIWNVQPNGYSSVSIKLNPKQSSGMGVSLCGSKTETDPPRWGCLLSPVSLSKEPYTHDIVQSIHVAVVSGICEVTLMVVFFP